MQPLAPADTHDTPARDVIDLEALLGDSNAQLVIEGLYRLRETKVEALRTLRAEDVRPNSRNFEPWDFGIPQIDQLLARFGAAPLEETQATPER